MKNLVTVVYGFAGAAIFAIGAIILMEALPHTRFLKDFAIFIVLGAAILGARAGFWFCNNVVYRDSPKLRPRNSRISWGFYFGAAFAITANALFAGLARESLSLGAHTTITLTAGMVGAIVGVAISNAIYLSRLQCYLATEPHGDSTEDTNCVEQPIT